MANRAVSEQKIGEWHNWLELAHKAGIKIGLWEWDVLTNTVTGSDESYRQFGFTHETFSGRLEDLVGRVHPQDRAGFAKTIDNMREGDREYASQFRVVTLLELDSQGNVDRRGYKRCNFLLGRDRKSLLLWSSGAEDTYLRFPDESVQSL